MVHGVRADLLTGIDPRLQLLRRHQRHLQHANACIPGIGFADLVGHHVAGRGKTIARQHRQRAAQIIFITIVKRNAEHLSIFLTV